MPVIDTAGDFAAFLWRGVRGMRGVSQYTEEVLRQTALLAAGSMLVIIWISFLTGATCGVTGSAISRAIGAGIAGPIFSAFCTTREVVPFIFGFIVAAKIGGGIVAQLGAMRVAEEVDAMEVMGVSSMTYLVSTRMLAALLMLPVAYMVGLGAAQGGSWIASFLRGADVSQGTWEFAFYTAITPIDLVYTLIKGLVLSFAVIATALYFGYRVRGGPVEVGEATARSMAVNLMTVTILNMIMTFIFWGFNPNLPVA
ncbi:MAG: ABC transporter permease [Thermoleophilaceae bacterium]|nr:ABC transporter permease [Thermoleophilaceae bacterium]